METLKIIVPPVLVGSIIALLTPPIVLAIVGFLGVFFLAAILTVLVIEQFKGVA